MAETYCGKACENCAHKESLSCPGCMAGPGRPISGDCSIAKCCREKGHQVCTTCGFSGNCGTLRNKTYMPEYRRKLMESEKMRAETLEISARFLGKWLWILFWLIVPSVVAAIMGNKNMAEYAPSIYVFGQGLSAVCSFFYGAILIRLSSEEERYRTAGICTLIGGAASALIAFVSGSQGTPSWTLVISIPAAIVGFVGEYNEFTAHSIVLADLDGEQSEKWSSLWKWYIGMYGAVLGSILVMAIAPRLGLLVVLGAAIGLIIVSILKPVYLYRTAKMFRDYIKVL